MMGVIRVEGGSGLEVSPICDLGFGILTPEANSRQKGGVLARRSGGEFRAGEGR